ncbi:MAG: hypothetical protein CME70_05165 [Halobacteriovorax sp.]|nr:hypothetical protein [Halobacteriovorax sp.]|tara:strand:+ start:24731 stop:24964 length:234 start_codon:yes stop_codon:yes gene_type:complete
MANGNAPESGWLDENGNVLGDDQKVPLSSLSELTGFPVEFIKKELLLEGEELSMSDLRTSMISYLETTAGQPETKEA